MDLRSTLGVLLAYLGCCAMVFWALRDDKVSFRENLTLLRWIMPTAGGLCCAFAIYLIQNSNAP
jgi:hypothetical protein